MLGGGIEMSDLSDDDLGMWVVGALSGAGADFEKAAGDTHNGKGILRRRGAGTKPDVRIRADTTAKYEAEEWNRMKCFEDEGIPKTKPKQNNGACDKTNRT